MPKRKDQNKAARQNKDKRIAIIDIKADSQKLKDTLQPKGGKGSGEINKGSINQRKLDTDVFQTYLDTMWAYTSFSQREGNTYLDCLWISDYFEKGDVSNALRWIVKKDIFTKRYVFVPICRWSHWFLVILCNFKEKFQSATSPPCILLLDSLQGDNLSQIKVDVRRLVCDICKEAAREGAVVFSRSITFHVPQVPQQTNGKDCGYYVLYFIKLFLTSAPASFSLQGYPYFLTSQWFTLEEFDSFKKYICKLTFFEDWGSTNVPHVDEGKLEDRKNALDSLQCSGSNQGSPMQDRLQGKEDVGASLSIRAQGSNKGTPKLVGASCRRTLLTNGKSFLGSLASRDIVNMMKCHFNEPWPQWKNVPKIVKELLWEKFKDKYIWPTEQTNLYRRVWAQTSQRNFSSMLEKARSEAKKKANTTNIEETKGFGPSWMAKETWDALIDGHWNNENWKKRSKAGHNNRRTEKDGRISKHSVKKFEQACHAFGII